LGVDEQAEVSRPLARRGKPEDIASAAVDAQRPPLMAFA
jgi:hypothetical protein